MLKTRIAKGVDAIYLEDKLRKEDQQELLASNTTLLESYNASQYTYCIHCEVPIALWGYSEFQEDGLVTGCIPWFLGSPRVLDHTPTLLFLAQSTSNLLLEKYGLLFNKVWKGNKVHVKWLESMQFTLSDAPDDDFYLFYRSRSS